MSTIAQLNINLAIQTSQLVRDAQRAKQVVSGLASSITTLLGGVALGAFVRSASNEFAEAETQTAKLNSVLQSTQQAAGFTLAQLEALATGLQDVTRAEDDTIKGGLAVLATFTQIKGDVFTEAAERALDMSAVFGGDLQSSITRIGKALNDPIKGVAALTKVGVSFTEQQKEQIKTLVESGRAVDAQRVILHELSVEFGGAARDSAKTYGGELDQMGVKLGNLKESFGQMFAPVIRLGNDLIGILIKWDGLLVKLMAAATVFVGVLLAWAAAEKAVAVGMAFIAGLTGQVGRLLAATVAAGGAMLLLGAELESAQTQVFALKTHFEDVAEASDSVNTATTAVKELKTGADETAEALANVRKQIESLQLAQGMRTGLTAPSQTSVDLERQARELEKRAARQDFQRGHTGFFQNGKEIMDEPAIGQDSDALRFRAEELRAESAKLKLLEDQKTIVEQMADLQREADQAGWSEAKKLDNHLRNMGASEQQIADARDAQMTAWQAKQDQRAEQERQDFADQAKEAAKSPLMKLKEELDRLELAHNAGDIGDDVFAANVAAAKKRFKDAQEKYKDEEKPSKRATIGALQRGTLAAYKAEKEGSMSSKELEQQRQQLEALKAIRDNTKPVGDDEGAALP